MRAPAPYSNPYLAGVGIGVVLLLAFVIMGRGLGASGAFSTVVAATVDAAAPAHTAGNAFYERYADSAANPLTDWLVVEIIGVVLGGMLSGGSLVDFAGQPSVVRALREGVDSRMPSLVALRWA